ncbi:MAG: hypothetical protein ACLQU2_00830 [Candidatus Binataceae bacterium]
MIRIEIGGRGEPALLSQIQRDIAEEKDLPRGESPLVSWDLVTGFKPLKQPGKGTSVPILQKYEAGSLTALENALAAAETLPERTIMLVSNRHWFIDEKGPALPAIMNLRDTYQKFRRTLVLLGTDFRLRAELAQDILIFDDALPDDSQLTDMLSKLYETNKVLVDPKLPSRATDALRGLAMFPAEQVAAFAVQRKNREGRQGFVVGQASPTCGSASAA